jgi:hypothetical protein
MVYLLHSRWTFIHTSLLPTVHSNLRAWAWCDTFYAFEQMCNDVSIIIVPYRVVSLH